MTVFVGSTTDAVFTTDCSIIQILVLWPNDKISIVKFPMICQMGQDSNQGPHEHTNVRHGHWTAKGCP